MKASIVVPVYNAERYLDECIRSALDQTYSDTEVIAVDDGSTDSSPEILKGYADRVRVLTKPNGGTASALNHGYRRMRGDWFKWLSADDALRPHAVEALMGAARSLGWPGDRIFYARYDFVDERGRPASRLRNIEPDNNDKSDFERNAILLHHFYGNGITSMFHRSIFERCGPFNETIGFNEDYEFWLRCCLLHGCRLHLIPHNVALSRVHSSQLTSTRHDETHAKNKRIRDLVLSNLPVDERERYLEAASRVRQPSYLPDRIRVAAHRALFACMPDSTAKKMVKTYHRVKRDGL